MIVRYVKDEYTGKTIGVVVAMKLEDDVYNIEYAYVSENKEFNREKGRKIAVKRCMDNKDCRVNTNIRNDNVLGTYMEVVKLAYRHFRGCTPSQKVLNMTKRYGRVYRFDTKNFID